MPTPTPVIGQWYRCATGELFEVVAIADEDAIEIQYFDGALEEFDRDTWEAQGLVEANPPEDWTGSVDVDQEDYDLEAENPHNAVWSQPSEYFDRSETSGFSEFSTGVQARYDN